MREYSDAFIHYFQRLFETSYVKMFLTGLLWCVHALFGPTIRPAMIAILVLCFLDFITGTIAAWLNTQDRIRSKRIRLSFLKIVLYAIIVATGQQLYTIGGPIFGPFGQGFLEALAGGTEALSVLENADRIAKYTGREIPWLNRLIRVIQGRQEAAVANLEKATFVKEDP